VGFFVSDDICGKVCAVTKHQVLVCDCWAYRLHKGERIRSYGHSEAQHVLKSCMYLFKSESTNLLFWWTDMAFIIIRLAHESAHFRPVTGGG
jgi:hypothetical protein